MGESDIIKKNYKAEKNIFENLIKSSYTWLKADDAEFAMRNIFSAGIFILFHRLRLNFSKTEVKPIDKLEIKAIIDKIYEISIKGFGTKKFNKNIDFEKIENSSAVKKNELPKRSKLFNAIASVVAEEGLWKASILKIANKFGQSKSSLYFYFANKNEMLVNMILSEITAMNKVISGRRFLYDSFEEKLYSDIIVRYSYMFQDKRIMLVFDWVHFQGLDFHKIFKNKKIEDLIDYSLIVQGVKNNMLTELLPLHEIEPFLVMQAVKEIILSERFGSVLSVKSMRLIYNFFISGIFLKGG